jgi:hypothetical protein
MGVWGLGNRVKLAVILTLSDSEGEESLSDRIYSFLLSIFEEVHAKSKTRCGGGIIFAGLWPLITNR